MHGDERREEIITAAKAVAAAEQQWAASEVEFVTDYFESAMDDLIEVCNSGAIPAECRALVRRVEALAVHWVEWKRRVDETGLVHEKLSDEFWASMEELHGARLEVCRPKRPRLEPVATLMALPNMTAEQVCSIYGWGDRSTGFDTWKVQEEIAEPGKHSYNCKEWVDPRERRQKEQEQAEADLIRRVREQRAAKVKRITQEPPEGLERLVKEGVSVRQLARMFHKTEEDIIGQCHALGLGDPAPNIPLHAQPLPEPVMQAAAEPEALQTMTVEQRIVELHQAGSTPEEIVTTLKAEGEKVTAKKVSATIDRYNEEPEAFL